MPVKEHIKLVEKFLRKFNGGFVIFTTIAQELKIPEISAKLGQKSNYYVRNLDSFVTDVVVYGASLGISPSVTKEMLAEYNLSKKGALKVWSDMYVRLNAIRNEVTDASMVKFQSLYTGK